MAHIVYPFLHLFLKKRLAQHLKTLYKLSWEFPLSVLQLVSSSHPGRCGASDINTFDCESDKDRSEASALTNTISKEVNHQVCVEESKRDGFIIDWSFNQPIS